MIGRGSCNRAAVVAVASKKQNIDHDDYDPIVALVVADCGDTELVRGVGGDDWSSEARETG